MAARAGEERRDGSNGGQGSKIPQKPKPRSYAFRKTVLIFSVCYSSACKDAGCAKRLQSESENPPRSAVLKDNSDAVFAIWLDGVGWKR
jgi:hypothetical protein